MGMGMGIAIVVIAVCTGLMIWRMRCKKAIIGSAPPENRSPVALAHKAFLNGNTCLVKGEFAAAIASFQQALALNPNHPHAANRLAEAEKRQAERANKATRSAS